MSSSKISMFCDATYNYAFERSVTALSERAAGARKIVAAAARRPRSARPAQRGR
jgi:hypothetical protein